MDISMLRKARRLWCTDTSPYHQQRANMRAWVRAIRVVGDNWLLLDQVKRKGNEYENKCNA